MDGRNSMIRKLLIAVYVVVGLIVANSHHYFKHLDGVKPVISAVLGVGLWPLVLFGVNLHIK
jgi:hypothetical protein